MRTAGTIFGIVLAAALGACAHQTATAPAQTAGGQAPAQATACPLAQLQGVHATVADIPQGVAITFTAPQSALDQLKENVHSMADANDKQGDAFAVCPCAQGGGAAAGAAEAMPGEPIQPGQTSMQPVTTMPRADSKVEEISTGAILRLTAKDKSQIGALRSAVRQNVHAFKRACLNQQPGQMEQQGGQKNR